jgi:hypothetical protein
MKYNEFLTAIMTYKKSIEDLSELRDIGVDLFEGKYKIVNHIESLMINTFNSHYTKEGVEWIEWFIYEADYGKKDFSKYPTYKKSDDGKYVKFKEEGEVKWGASDENGEPICYSYESLHGYIEKFKINIKK